MFVLILCDTAAAIIGKSFGKIHIKNKTVEGSTAFLISGIILVLFAPKVTEDIYEYYMGFAVIFLTTLVELIPIKVDDNIIIPIFFGLVYTGGLKLIFS
jgi:dolichol kinase